MCRSQNQVHEDDWFGAWEGWPELSGSWWLVLPHFFSWVLLCLLSSGIFVWVTHLWKKLLWTPEHRQRFLFSVSIWGDVLLLTFYFNIFRLFLFLYKLTFRLFLLIMIKEIILHLLLIVIWSLLKGVQIFYLTFSVSLYAPQINLCHLSTDS